MVLLIKFYYIIVYIRITGLFLIDALRIFFKKNHRYLRKNVINITFKGNQIPIFFQQKILNIPKKNFPLKKKVDKEKNADKYFAKKYFPRPCLICWQTKGYPLKIAAGFPNEMEFNSSIDPETAIEKHRANCLVYTGCKISLHHALGT